MTDLFNAESLTIRLGCDSTALDTAKPSERIIEITVQAAQSLQTQSRLPLNIALVIDRSGSMGGEKLPYVQEAACHVLDRLTDRDQVAVIAFDDEVQVLSPSVVADTAQRERLKTAVRRLRPGSSTNLHDGWLNGAAQVADHMTAESVNSVLLFTDGAANVGVVDVETLAQEAKGLRKQRVTTSTFGVGDNFNERVLEPMAIEGGGHYYYIATPREIPAIFQRELGELEMVVAREATLDLAIPAGTSVTLTGDLPHEQTSARLRIPMNNLFAGETRLFYVKMLTPFGTRGEELPLEATLSFAPNSGQVQKITQTLAFVYTENADAAPRDKALRERAADIEMAVAATEALHLEREGKGREAAALMRRSLAVAAPAAPLAAAYARQADEMEAGLSPEASKAHHAEASRKRNSRQ